MVKPRSTKLGDRLELTPFGVLEHKEIVPAIFGGLKQVLPVFGRFLISSDAAMPLEAGWRPASISVVEFPSFDAARVFYESEAYQRTIPLRQRA